MSQLDTNQLLELAALDVLGMLDPEEREAFEAAFSAAPPELQADIRREQLRVARNDRMLPRIDAPLGLRARVLAAIKEAMQTVSARKEVAGRTAPAALQLAPVQGVSRWWRAASIGAMAAAVALGAVALQFRSDYTSVQSVNKSTIISQTMQKHFGTWLERDLFSPSTRLIAFSPIGSWTNPEGIPKCILLVDGSGGDARVFVKNLPTATRYSLVGLDKDGKVVRAFAALPPSTTPVIDQVTVADMNLTGVVSVAIAETDSLTAASGPMIVLRSATL